MAERIVNPLPGPYFLKILSFWIIFGTPGLVLARYLDTFNTEKIVSLFGVISPQNILVFSLANFVMPLYAFYGIRHMRQKLLQTMPKLRQVAADGTSTVDGVFRSTTQLLPAIILGVFFSVLSIASLPGQTQHVVGYLSLLVKVFGFAFSMFAYGTFIWMYVGSIVGLYRLGRKRLRFTPFYEDKHLGMKSLGSISLSLVWVYFLGIGLVFFSFSPLPLLLLLALGGLTVLGVVLFFLPLYEIHVKMMKEKQAAEKALRTRLRQVVETLESSKESTCEITDLLAFQLLEQKVSKISEWPFDTTTLSWLSAIIISVIGAIITRYLLAFTGS
jgi:hypothetical protein